MICKECSDQGLKSKVYPQGGSSTALYCAPFYDEDGVYHFHDMNRHTHGYNCSNSHRWSEISENKCPACDWTNK